MTGPLQICLRGTFKQDVRRLHISHPHVIVFGQQSTNLWQLSPDSRSMKNRIPLSPFIDHPGREGVFTAEIADTPRQGTVFVDEARDIIVIPKVASRPHAIWVYGLHSGLLIRKIEEVGDLEVCGMQYTNGRSLVAVDEYDEDFNKRTTIRLCDVAGDGRLLRGLTLPSHLETCPYTSFVPILLTSDTDILATSSGYSEEKMGLFRWEGSDSENSPSRTVEIALRLEYGSHIRTSCSIPMDDGNFVISGYEHVLDHLEVADGAQSTLHLLETVSLDERWCAEPILGRVYSMQYVTSCKVIVAIAKMDEREDGGDYDIATTVAVLDSNTGVLRRADKINYRKHGCPVQECALSEAEDAADIVVIFADGGISVTPLDVFLQGGFERDGDSIKVSRTLESDVKVTCGAVGNRSAILVTGENSEFSFVSW